MGVMGYYWRGLNNSERWRRQLALSLTMTTTKRRTMVITTRIPPKTMTRRGMVMCDLCGSVWLFICLSGVSVGLSLCLVWYVGVGMSFSCLVLVSHPHLFHLILSLYFSIHLFLYSSLDLSSSFVHLFVCLFVYLYVLDMDKKNRS